VRGLSGEHSPRHQDRVRAEQSRAHLKICENIFMAGAGGEKRRLTISCSLIAKPSILFLDEPTTGLDAFAALNIMDHMSCLAALGHTIIASVHQPRSAIWDMFHKARATGLNEPSGEMHH
jgi:ABC-type multidrug transport system ATPase subunit